MSKKPTGGSFKPGYDPRREGAGRKPGQRSIPDMLRRIGAEMTVDEEGKPIDKLERVLQRVFDHARAGQGWAVQFIAERTEGKVKDMLEVTDVRKPPQEMTREEIEAELRKDG